MITVASSYHRVCTYTSNTTQKMQETPRNEDEVFRQQIYTVCRRDQNQDLYVFFISWLNLLLFMAFVLCEYQLGFLFTAYSNKKKAVLKGALS